MTSTSLNNNSMSTAAAPDSQAALHWNPPTFTLKSATTTAPIVMSTTATAGASACHHQSQNHTTHSGYGLAPGNNSHAPIMQHQYNQTTTSSSSKGVFGMSPNILPACQQTNNSYPRNPFLAGNPNQPPMVFGQSPNLLPLTTDSRKDDPMDVDPEGWNDIEEVEMLDCDPLTVQVDTLHCK